MEIGWCNLPNGAGYIANRIHHPEFTADMVDWWFAWHPLEDLRYRIWYPPQHAGIMLSPIDRARILDDSIPNREKNWGVVHNVTENCDCGFENVDIAFRSPADMGFDMEKFGEVAATMAAGQGWAVAVEKCDESITAPAIMCHMLYDAPEGGLIHRTRFWMGYRFNEAGKPELCLPPGVSVPGGGRPGPGAPQRQGVHALARVPAADPRGAGPEHVLLDVTAAAPAPAGEPARADTRSTSTGAAGPSSLRPLRPQPAVGQVRRPLLRASGRSGSVTGQMSSVAKSAGSAVSRSSRMKRMRSRPRSPRPLSASHSSCRA